MKTRQQILKYTENLWNLKFLFEVYKILFLKLQNELWNSQTIYRINFENHKVNFKKLKRNLKFKNSFWSLQEFYKIVFGNHKINFEIQKKI